MRALLGANSWTAALFCFCVFFVAFLFLITIFAILYHRLIYRKYRRSKYDPAHTPRVSVIVPCKGVPKGLKENLESFLSLDYPSYEVLFAVESRQDPALAVIEQVVGKAPGRASLVVAGLSTHCAQKNYNQLAAVKTASRPEVYVFADSDIGPSANWLRELVLPLSDPAVTVTTGFRWQFSSHGKIGEQVHSFQNNLLYVAFCAAAAISKLNMLWGGSMAMRKRDFDDLGVAARWGETVVDDISLSQIMMKNSRKVVLVPPCVTVTDDAIQNLGQAIRWFERQTMYFKAYHRRTWTFMAVPLVTVVLFTHLWLPVSLIAGRFSLEAFLRVGGAGPLVFVLGTMATVLLYPLLGANPRLVGFILLQPLSAFSILIGALRTLFTNTVTWGNIKYTLTFRGTVASIQRPSA